MSEEKDFVRIAHFGRIFIWVDFFSDFFCRIRCVWRVTGCKNRKWQPTKIVPSSLEEQGRELLTVEEVGPKSEGGSDLLQ